MTRIPTERLLPRQRCPTCAGPVFWAEAIQGYQCPRCDRQGDEDGRFQEWRLHQLGLLSPDPVTISLPSVPSVHVDTSEEAAASMEEHQSRLAREVLALIRASAPSGVTCDRIEELMNLRHQTASARVRELVLAGWVEDSGRRRENRSGRKGILWVPFGSAQQGSDPAAAGVAGAGRDPIGDPQAVGAAGTGG